MTRRNAILIPLLCLTVAHPLSASTDFDTVIETASKRVVRLFGLKAGLSAGYGCGVLISDDGLVVTVASLLLDAENLRAIAADGTTYGADVIARDDDLQLALLKLKPWPQYDRRGRRLPGAPVGPGKFEYFTPGDSTTLTPGDWIIAAGNPFKVAQGKETISHSLGVFSVRTELDAHRKARPFPYRGDVLVVDAITSTPGSPGGALLNLDGEWVGLLGRIVIANRTHTNLNYALPVETVMGFVDDAMNPDSRDKSEDEQVATYHGIKLFELGYQKKMVYVDKVRRRSPARRGGVKKDDLIVSVNGHSVTDIESFNDEMGRFKPGDKIEFVVIRSEKIKMISFQLEQAKP